MQPAYQVINTMYGQLVLPRDHRTGINNREQHDYYRPTWS